MLAQRALVYSLIGDVLMKELNRILKEYELAVTYYQLELSALFLPSDYLNMKKRRILLFIYYSIGWRIAMKNLNEINLYISMNDFEKALDLIDQGITNLYRLSLIPKRLEGIQSVSIFPEVFLLYLFYSL